VRSKIPGICLIVTACGAQLEKPTETLVVPAELSASILSSVTDTYIYKVLIDESDRVWFRFRVTVATNTFFALDPSRFEPDSPPSYLKVTLPAGGSNAAQQVIMITFNAP
jgi:hypothetical protein